MEGKQKKSWRERAGQAVCLALLCMVMAGMLFSGKEVIGISAAMSLFQQRRHNPIDLIQLRLREGDPLS